jgi:heme ABC exporter ATP-binding subunit CcmA
LENTAASAPPSIMEEIPSDSSISSKHNVAVSCTDLCRRFGARWALRNVSLTASYGTAFLVVGRNGSGKTTLFRILATAIRFDKGRARVAGFDLGRQRDQARSRTMLMSHHSYLYEALTAYENLELAARVAGESFSPAALRELLERVELEDRAHDFVSEFSAGMRKRLALARALIRKTPVVLFDEPYGQLDPQGFALVDRVIDECRRRGAAVLLATHHIDRGCRICRDALVLDHGRCSWSGQAADLPLSQLSFSQGAEEGTQ